MEEWIKEVTIEMIPDSYRDLVSKLEVEGFLKLAQAVGGTTIYVPKLDQFIRQVRDEKIREEFNGYNHNYIALKYNITSRRVLEICRVDKMDGQIDLYQGS